jgi:hypothetical protein
MVGDPNHGVAAGNAIPTSKSYLHSFQKFEVLVMQSREESATFGKFWEGRCDNSIMIFPRGWHLANH